LSQKTEFIELAIHDDAVTSSDRQAIFIALYYNALVGTLFSTKHKETLRGTYIVVVVVD